MFPGKENPRGTAMESLFVEIFERKRRIVEQVKQRVDLFDQHLASKCLLAGVPPPTWLWSPSVPLQASELNKEEIISELLLPPSRPSIIFPNSHPFSYQQPVSCLADRVVREDLPGDVHEKEKLSESVLLGCRENQSFESPKHSQNQRVETDLDVTFSECSQANMVSKSVSTTGDDQKPSPPGYYHDETEPNTYLDPGLSLAKMQRSRSRQKDLELRSSAKASKSCSDCKIDLKPSLGGEISLGITSLRSDSLSEIKIFKPDENDEGCRDEVENSNSQGKGGDQGVKTSLTTESFTLHQKVDLVQNSFGGDASASTIPETLMQSGHVNDIDLLQSIKTIDEVSAKVDEQVDDLKSKSCNGTAYLDESTKSKSFSQDSNKIKHQKSGNSFSGNFLSGNSNPSHWADHEVELPEATPMTNEVSTRTGVGMSIFQSEVIARSGSKAQENRSKTKHSGSVESSSINVEPRDSVSVLQGSHVKDSLNPSNVDLEGLVAESITSSHQSKEKGESVDTNRCLSAGRVIQTGMSCDETTFAGAMQDSTSKIEHLSFVESSPIVLQSRHSVNQSDVENVLLKPVTVTGESLLVEEDKNGESTKVSSISKSRSVSQEMQPLGSLTKARSNQCHQKISRPRSSAMEEESENEHKALSVGSDHKSAYKQLEVREGNSSLRSPNCPVFGSSELSHFDGNEERNVDEVPEDSQEKSTMEKVPTPVPAGKVFDVPLLTDSGVNISADNEMNDIMDHKGLRREMVPETETHATHSGLKVGGDEPTESNTFIDHIDASTKRPRHETCSEKSVPLIKRDVTRTVTDESHDSESSIKDFFYSSSSMGTSMQPNKRRRTLNEPTTRVLSPSPGVNILGSDSVGETVHHRDEVACHNLDNYEVELQKMIGSASLDGVEKMIGSASLDGVELQKMIGSASSDVVEKMIGSASLDGVELQKMIGSASSDVVEKMIGSASLDGVELQKMIGSASSASLLFEESYLFKDAGLMSPASLSISTEQLRVQRSQIAPYHEVGSENINFLPYDGETSHGLASCTVHNSDDSPCLSPLGLISSENGSSPVLEGCMVQNDDKKSVSKNQLNHDSFQLPRTTVESAAMIEQICKSACTTTPSLDLAKPFKFDLSVSTELFDDKLFCQNLEGSSVFDHLGINNDYTGRLYTDSLPLSGPGSSSGARNPCTSPSEKLWYRILQKSSSSEKHSSQTPELPCISEENENIEEEAENLSMNDPKFMRSEKRGSSIPDLPCIAEESENLNEISDAFNEASGCERETVSAEMKPLGNVNEDPTKFLPSISEASGYERENSAERKPLSDVNEDLMKFLPSISEAKIPVDRQSLDSVNTAFSFSATNSVKSKVGKQSNRRFVGKGKENPGAAGAKKNVKPPSSRFSKPNLSCNSSLTTVGPRLPEKEPRHNNIVSNVRSFLPLVQQPKPAPALITGKRDVKVKALEAAEASKRIAEQKENDRKLKKEAMKLERARQEQENLRKQEIEKKKKEEDRKKKEAEMAWKQEMEKKKKEEERKRKEFEMADRKRQREEENKKWKEAKKQRVAEIQRQQREADAKPQAEKELKRQAMDAQKELKEDQSNAEKTRGQTKTRIPEVRSKSNTSDDTNASRSSTDNDFKVISKPRKMSGETNIGIERMEESYDISPYKGSDDEDEEEDDNDDMSNKKFVPTWASKSNVLHAVISQQKLDPSIIFPAKSFCDINKVLLPRRLQSR